MGENQITNGSGSSATSTLYQVAFRNQISLIQIADHKANLVIIINMLIIGAIISISGYGLVSERIQHDKVNVIIPVTLILVSCLTSAIFAIQVAKPKLIKPRALALKKSKSSLLFFGEISKFTQEEYLEHMKKLISSDSDIYETMNIDLHNQGLILARKYELLSTAYKIFMFGFIVSVWAFLVFLIGI